MSTFRRLAVGDVLRITCNVSAGLAELTINDGEFSQVFNIPADREYIMGATFCNDHSLTVQDWRPSEHSAIKVSDKLMQRPCGYYG